MDGVEHETSAGSENPKAFEDARLRLGGDGAVEHVPRVASRAPQKVMPRPNSRLSRVGSMLRQFVCTGLITSYPASIRQLVCTGLITSYPASIRSGMGSQMEPQVCRKVRIRLLWCR